MAPMNGLAAEVAVAVVFLRGQGYRWRRPAVPEVIFLDLARMVSMAAAEAVRLDLITIAADPIWEERAATDGCWWNGEPLT